MEKIISLERRIEKRLRKSVTTAGILFLVLVAGFYALGFRINTTISEPKGLYVLTGKNRPERGDLVIACPPIEAARLSIRRGYLHVSGNCPGGAIPFLKTLVAVPGDYVVMDRHGLSVNGKAVPNSTPLSVDSAGRKIERMRFRGRTTGYWLISSYSRKSFDSRYWGPVDRGAILSSIDPVLVF